MRIYPGTTVDYEYKALGDRQSAALKAEGLGGALADMFKQFDGTLETPDL